MTRWKMSSRVPAVVSLFVAAAALAAVPQSLTQHGRLFDGDGMPVNGTSPDEQLPSSVSLDPGPQNQGQSGVSQSQPDGGAAPEEIEVQEVAVVSGGLSSHASAPARAEAAARAAARKQSMEKHFLVTEPPFAFTAPAAVGRQSVLVVLFD